MTTVATFERTDTRTFIFAFLLHSLKSGKPYHFAIIYVYIVYIYYGEVILGDKLFNVCIYARGLYRYT